MNIAVLGAGPIGNLVAQTAKGMGAAKVMITDISDLRLAKAKECGIDVCATRFPIGPAPRTAIFMPATSPICFTP